MDIFSRLRLNGICFCSTCFFLNLPRSIGLPEHPPWKSNPSSPRLYTSPAIPHPCPVTKWSDQSEHCGSPGTAENPQGCRSGLKIFEENSHTQHLLDIVWTTNLDYTAFLSTDGIFCKVGFLAIVEIKSKSHAKISVEQETKVAVCNLIPRLKSCNAQWTRTFH